MKTVLKLIKMSNRAYVYVSEMREQHESEIHNLENLMKASQDMLQQQVTKYSDQMQRLGKLFSVLHSFRILV